MAHGSIIFSNVNAHTIITLPSTPSISVTVEASSNLQMMHPNLPLYVFQDPKSFVNSIQKVMVIMLINVEAPVDQTIKTLSAYLEKGDCIIDGGNEWYENTVRREKEGMKGTVKWDKGELLSFLTEITPDIFGIKDIKGEGYLVDTVLDKIGMKGMGKWTIRQAGDFSVTTPTIASSLDARFLSGLKEERITATSVFKLCGLGEFFTSQEVDKEKLIDDVRNALYASKICTYAQGMKLIRAKSYEKGGCLRNNTWCLRECSLVNVFTLEQIYLVSTSVQM